MDFGAHAEFQLLPYYTMENGTHIFPCGEYIYFLGCKKHISFGLVDVIKGPSQLMLHI